MLKIEKPKTIGEVAEEISHILPARYSVYPLKTAFCFFKEGKNSQVIVNFQPKLKFTPHDYWKKAAITFNKII